MQNGARVKLARGFALKIRLFLRGSFVLSSRPERRKAVVHHQNLRRGVERSRWSVLLHATSGSSPHAFSLSLFSDLCLGWARAKTRTLCFRKSSRRPKARPATTSGLERTPCNRIAEQTFSGSLHSALQCLFGGRSLWRSGRDDSREREFSKPATNGLIALVVLAVCA